MATADVAAGDRDCGLLGAVGEYVRAIPAPRRIAYAGCRSLGRVSRPQPRVARPWLLRGLLVLLALAGLGIWQGGHCIDDASAHHPVSVAALASDTTLATAGFGATAAPAMSAHHRDMHAAGLSSTTADTCSIAPTIVTRTTMTVTPVVPAAERAAPVAASSRPLAPRCFAPSVALTRLGISRT